MSIIIAILIFSLIVIIHELGHFLLAKKNGICVTEFSLGMGPRILTTVKGETRYSLKLFPIGGSCMMLGEDEDNDEENAFGSKSVAARISVIAAGPIFNFILAFVLSVIIIGSVGFDEPRVQNVIEGYPVEQAGIEPGDMIVKMNKKRIHNYREISNYAMFHPGETVNIVYERDGERQQATIVPQQDEDGNYLMGFYGSSGVRTKGNALDVIKYGFYEVEYWISLTIESLGMLFTGEAGLDDMAGPVGVVNIIGETYEESKQDGAYYVWLNMLNISILLTANLGVMNLLPIPALDGGRLIFLILEGIRRKPIPPEKEGMVHFIGLMALLLLMVVVLFNDIRRLF